MSKSNVRSDDKRSSFATFPKFTKLTYAHRREYEEWVAEYPPVCASSFATLMTWWNLMDTCAVAELNGNLIVTYWFPAIEKYSGLSVIGTNKMDETLCTVFDYLKARGDPARVVHMSEFAVRSMRYPELFKFTAERGFDEYIVPVNRLYPLSRDVVAHRRWRIRKMLAEIDEDRIMVKSLDLELPENQELMVKCAHQWFSRKTINDISKLEREVFLVSVKNAKRLGVENMCLYVDDKLEGFSFYFLPTSDKEYATMTHFKVNCDSPRVLDLLTYQTAKWFASKGVKYANLDCDLGIPVLRIIKLSIGPTTSFRKYTVEPVV